PAPPAELRRVASGASMCRPMSVPPHRQHRQPEEGENLDVWSDQPCCLIRAAELPADVEAEAKRLHPGSRSCEHEVEIGGRRGGSDLEEPIVDRSHGSRRWGSEEALADHVVPLPLAPDEVGVEGAETPAAS